MTDPPAAGTATPDVARAAASTLLRDARSVQPPNAAALKPAERLQAFALLDAAAKDADAASKLLKALREDMNESVVGALDALGLQRAPLAGGPTIYRSRELWAGLDLPDDVDDDEKAAIRERACQALKDEGLDDYVQEGFNSQSLSGYFRDRERELEDDARERDGLPDDAPVAVDPDDLLPEGLRGVIRLTERVQAKAKTS